MIAKIKAHFRKKREAKWHREQANREARNRKVGRHHRDSPLEVIEDFIEELVDWK